MTTLGEELGLTVYRHRRTGVWTVPSRELARVTAHEHYNILGAARLAERELGLSHALIWGSYAIRRAGNRLAPCCWIPRDVLAQMRLHNVKGCRYVRDVMAEYLRLLDMHEAAQPAQVAQPELPMPKPRREKPPPKIVSMITATEAIDALAAQGLPERWVRKIRDWDSAQRFEQLQQKAKSWTEVAAMFREHQPKPRGEARP